MPLDDFIVYKRLSKKLNEYNEQTSKSLPHVQVARRMEAKGVSVRMGDVIPYIFCLAEDGSSSIKGAQADRAFHPDEIRRKDSGLLVDLQHYLACQILPPIERLCESIVGTDRGRLASHLGLDPAKFQSTSIEGGQQDSRDFVTLDSQTPDVVRFAGCEPFTVACGQCKDSFPFLGLVGVLNGDATACKVLPLTGTIVCPACAAPIRLPYLVMQLETAIRNHIARYYQAWSVCTEPLCGTSTRMQGIYPKNCLVQGCKGKVVVKYTDKELYDQLCYFETLFDGQRCLDRATQDSQQLDLIQSRWIPGSQGRQSLQLLYETVAKYTAKSGRRFVGLQGLFGWMKVSD